MNLSLSPAQGHRQQKSKKSFSKKHHTPLKIRFMPGYSDANGSYPLGYKIPSSQPYFDLNVVTGVSTTPQKVSLLTGLLGSGGILASFPAFSTPVIIGAGTVQQFQKVKILGCLVSIQVTGSRGNQITTSDYTNILKTMLHWTGKNYQSTADVNPLTGTNGWPDLRDVEEVYLDNKFLLSDTTFDSTSNNVPEQDQYRCYIPMNRIIECFSPNTAIWDTREGDLLFAQVSDSSIAPNPVVNAAFRIFYEIIRDQVR
jgi:hypothetical protein